MSAITTSSASHDAALMALAITSSSATASVRPIRIVLARAYKGPESITRGRTSSHRSIEAVVVPIYVQRPSYVKATSCLVTTVTVMLSASVNIATLRHIRALVMRHELHLSRLKARVKLMKN